MYRCNFCGELIKKSVDSEPVLEVKHVFGYQSNRDMDKLNVVLCGECTEDLTNYLIDKCVINPISESVLV